MLELKPEFRIRGDELVEILNGKAVAKNLNERTAKRVATLKERGITPGIAVIYVGDDPASAIYTRNKDKMALRLGMNSQLMHLPATATQEEVMAVLQEYNQDPMIHGILIQSPLPKHLDEHALVQAIRPDKDVDGFHSMNVGRLYNNEPGNYPVSCTPRGIMTMLDHYGIELAGKRVVIMGRSILVGRPLQALLINRDATVTMVHRHTKDPEAFTRQADILIVGIGQPQAVTSELVKPGAIVIDVGIHRTEKGKLIGDVDYDSVKEVAGMLTPVPGGVGPMTIASLMAQTVDLAEWSIRDDQ
ncbi:Bifunctional protein folD [Limosilactobacillus gastricus PS3]|uniref:Bifunctional protein FolD n=1 Tax=Limosilactobacillus gastricus PS3 TaxID=1144300 RepID=H4GJD6_9LACO|nr:bifunctional methylenetetrahydrofolate dehydrogenase/methenyltetrahydrofolate cyclohydrolase FolD [Limosilactobacillus gastricus]EHS86885.1 Bifunctional protein folD [Limosilactobacillus gastricus PS3]QGF40606.1 bifunctional methylenetetrahydrofolate dehydrogenase/methenyltetrahydrofolate cyclohydrolase FolD [Limosilactobacillus gastricus]